MDYFTFFDLDWFLTELFHLLPLCSLEAYLVYQSENEYQVYFCKDLTSP